MTKERRIAIKMWEFVVEHLHEDDVYDLKESFTEIHPEVAWQNDCWFCEYCRRDRRSFHPGREHIDMHANNCHLCPLYQYEIEHGNYTTSEDACGCENSSWHSYPLFAKVQHLKDQEAAEKILRLLKGEKF